MGLGTLQAVKRAGLCAWLLVHFYLSCESFNLPKLTPVAKHAKSRHQQVFLTVSHLKQLGNHHEEFTKKKEVDSNPPTTVAPLPAGPGGGKPGAGMEMERAGAGAGGGAAVPPAAGDEGAPPSRLAPGPLRRFGRRVAAWWSTRVPPPQKKELQDLDGATVVEAEFAIHDDHDSETPMHGETSTIIDSSTTSPDTCKEQDTSKNWWNFWVNGEEDSKNKKSKNDTEITTTTIQAVEDGRKQIQAEGSEAEENEPTRPRKRDALANWAVLFNPFNKNGTASENLENQKKAPPPPPTAPPPPPPNGAAAARGRGGGGGGGLAGRLPDFLTSPPEFKANRTMAALRKSQRTLFGINPRKGRLTNEKKIKKSSEAEMFDTSQQGEPQSTQTGTNKNSTRLRKRDRVLRLVSKPVKALKNIGQEGRQRLEPPPKDMLQKLKRKNADVQQEPVVAPPAKNTTATEEPFANFVAGALSLFWGPSANRSASGGGEGGGAAGGGGAGGAAAAGDAEAVVDALLQGARAGGGAAFAAVGALATTAEGARERAFAAGAAGVGSLATAMERENWRDWVSNLWAADRDPAAPAAAAAAGEGGPGRVAGAGARVVAVAAGEGTAAAAAPALEEEEGQRGGRKEGGGRRGEGKKGAGGEAAAAAAAAAAAGKNTTAAPPPPAYRLFNLSIPGIEIPYLNSGQKTGDQNKTTNATLSSKRYPSASDAYLSSIVADEDSDAQLKGEVVPLSKLKGMKVNYKSTAALKASIRVMSNKTAIPVALMPNQPVPPTKSIIYNTSLEAALLISKKEQVEEYLGQVGLGPVVEAVEQGPRDLARHVKGLQALEALTRHGAERVRCGEPRFRFDLYPALAAAVQRPLKMGGVATAVRGPADTTLLLAAQLAAARTLYNLALASDEAVAELRALDAQLQAGRLGRALRALCRGRRRGQELGRVEGGGPALALLRETAARADPARAQALTDQIQWTASALVRSLGLYEWKPRTPGQRGVRVLCLDGGGTKGVLTIKMLQKVCKAIGKQPYDFFDIISGTSTGAIIAFLIVMQQEDTDQLEARYDSLIKDIFSSGNNYKLVIEQAYYNEQNWEAILLDILQDRRMLDVAPDAPLLFAVSTLFNYEPQQMWLWRNYNYPAGSSSRHRGTWRERARRALRATTAAPTFFYPLARDGNLYSDGALIANNPAAVAFQEAGRAFPGVPVELVVSLGTGHSPSEAKEPQTSWGNVVTQLINSATDTELIDGVLADILSANTYYFRMNPNLDTVYKIDETDSERLNDLKKVADSYFSNPINIKRLEQLSMIARGETPPTTKPSAGKTVRPY